MDKETDKETQRGFTACAVLTLEREREAFSKRAETRVPPSDRFREYPTSLLTSSLPE